MAKHTLGFMLPLDVHIFHVFFTNVFICFMHLGLCDSVSACSIFYLSCWLKDKLKLNQKIDVGIMLQQL